MYKKLMFCNICESEINNIDYIEYARINGKIEIENISQWDGDFHHICSNCIEVIGLNFPL